MLSASLNKTLPFLPLNHPVMFLLQSANAEGYFVLHSGVGHTSENTLSKLKTPKMETESVNKLLRTLPTGHTKEFQDLLSENKEVFSNWMFQMW